LSGKDKSSFQEKSCQEYFLIFSKKRERELRSARKQKMKKNSIRKSNRHIAKYDPESAMTSTVPRKVLLVLDKCLCFVFVLEGIPASARVFV